MINFDKIESFDMNKITNKISVIVGKRAAGKTTLIQDYLFITKKDRFIKFLKWQLLKYDININNI